MSPHILTDDSMEVEFAGETLQIGELKKKLYSLTEDRMRVAFVTQHRELLLKMRHSEIPFTSTQLKEALSAIAIHNMKLYGLIAAFRPTLAATHITYYVVTKVACELLDETCQRKKSKVSGERRD